MNNAEEFEELGVIPHPLVYSNEDGFIGWMNVMDVDQLLSYYKMGIFPWESYENLGALFFPQRRYLIKPSEIKVPKSIRPYFNQDKFRVTYDQAFKDVILGCKYVYRKGSTGTWISDEFVEIYCQLHDRGYAHSVEVWEGRKLVGGLYGVSIGRIFTGESMFSLTSNASRFALISLARKLEEFKFKYIDCQISNPYLDTFGGKDYDSTDFFKIIKSNFWAESIVGNWGRMFESNSVQETSLPV